MIANQPGQAEGLIAFTQRLWTYIDEHAQQVQKLIIDLRYKPGGNGDMASPFLHEIIHVLPGMRREPNKPDSTCARRAAAPALPVV